MIGRPVTPMRVAAVVLVSLALVLLRLADRTPRPLAATPSAAKAEGGRDPDGALLLQSSAAAAARLRLKLSSPRPAAPVALPARAHAMDPGAQTAALANLSKRMEARMDSTEAAVERLSRTVVGWLERQRRVDDFSSASVANLTSSLQVRGRRRCRCRCLARPHMVLASMPRVGRGLAR